MNESISTPDIHHGPLYKRVKRLLTQGLAAGEWKPNEAIPSESKLAQRFNVSIGTVRKAIDELAAENILVRQQGRGTFVATHSVNRYLYHFYHVINEDGTKHLPVPELLQYRRIKADARLASRLNLERGDRVIHVRNLLRMQGKPVEVYDIYLDAARFDALDRESFEQRKGPVYQLYQERLGLNVIRTSEQLRAVGVGPEEAPLLGVAVNTPVLQVERIAYTYHDTPVEYRCSLVNTTAHVYQSVQEASP